MAGYHSKHLLPIRSNYRGFCILKPIRRTYFSNLILEWNSTCFGQLLCPSSGFFHCTHSNGICYTGLLKACEQEHLLLLTSCQQTCMTYTIAVCSVKNSWWWTEELSETRRFHSKNKFEKLVHLVDFFVRNLWGSTFVWDKGMCCELGDIRSVVEIIPKQSSLFLFAAFRPSVFPLSLLSSR